VINEYLAGKGILKHAQIEVVRFSAQETAGKIGIDATLGVTGTTRAGGYGTDSIEIYRTIDRSGKECSFDKLGASTINLKGFGVEYYRRVVPLLRKLGIEKIVTMPTTGPEESPEKYQFIGAYIWSFYGYTNNTMAGILNQYVDYLKNEKKISLSKAEEGDILGIQRMVKLATDSMHGEPTGEKFLRGKDAQGNPTRALWWKGNHKNINDESNSNIEMMELVNYLLLKMR